MIKRIEVIGVMVVVTVMAYVNTPPADKLAEIAVAVADALIQWWAGSE